MLHRLGTRIAHELLTPRVLPLPLAWVGRAIAIVIVVWGFAVCATITAAVAAAVLGI